MAKVKHVTPADGTFSPTGAAEWDRNHFLSGVADQLSLDALSNALSAELVARAAGDNALSAAIDVVSNAVSALEATNSASHLSLNSRITSAIAGYISLVNQEVSNRQSADNVLSNRLSTWALDNLVNVSAPTPGDGQVLKWSSAQGQWIAANDETAGAASVTSTELSAAAAALSGRIDSVDAVMSGRLNSAALALGSEISNRISADNVLSGRIDSVHSVLSQRISALSLDALANVSAPTPTDGQVLKWNSAQGQWIADTDLTGGAGGSVTSTELSAAAAALSARIDSVANAASVVSAALASEISNRISADNVLSARIASLAGTSIQARSVAALQSIAVSTFTNISGLSLSVEAGGIYSIGGWIFTSTSAALAGSKWQFTHPAIVAGQGGAIRIVGQTKVSATGQIAAFSVSPCVMMTAISVAAGDIHPIRLNGIFRASAAGVLQLQAAPVLSAAASPLHIIPGSYIRARRLN